MWLFVAFDLPSVSTGEKRAHAKFRSGLLRLGLMMLQWSMYARAYPNEAASETARSVIAASVPRGGRVRLFSITDRQFEKMVCIDGERRKKPEKKLEQLILLE